MKDYYFGVDVGGTTIKMGLYSQKSGWVNNELQNYVNGEVYGKRVTELADGKLHIRKIVGIRIF